MKCLKKIHDFLTDREKIRSELFWIKKLWYVLLLVIFTRYVCSNFDIIVIQSFVYQFNGNSLIFILWLVLLFLPLFNSIEGYGFKFSKEREIQEKQSFEIKILKDEMLKNNSIPEINELEKQYESVKESKDE